jgi:superoxide dismutase, Cu-Zn family
MRNTLTALIAAAMMAPPSLALAVTASAEVQNADRMTIGAVRLSDTPSGTVLVNIELTDLPEGIHGVHFHETGDCSADDFSSAGGHIAGDASHGVQVEEGPHPGDLPNVTVREDGVVQTELFLTDFDIEQYLLDEDGAAFVVHSGLDDYESQPSGNSGDRIACGEFGAGRAP